MRAGSSVLALLVRRLDLDFKARALLGALEYEDREWRGVFRAA